MKPKTDTDSRLLAAIQRQPGKPLAAYHAALYLAPLRIGHLTALQQAAERLAARKLVTVTESPDGPLYTPTPNPN